MRNQDWIKLKPRLLLVRSRPSDDWWPSVRRM